MRVDGHSPVGSYPSVPSHVRLDGGECVGRPGIPAGDTPGPWADCGPTDVPAGHWVIAMSPGVVETFPSDDEHGWRARRATELIEQSTAAARGGDPLGAVSLINAAAALTGLRLADVIERLRAAKAPGETYEQALSRLRQRPAR